MKRQDVEPGDALVTRYSHMQFRTPGDLLDGKVIPDCSRSVPDEMMDAFQSTCLTNQGVEQVVNCFL